MRPWLLLFGGLLVWAVHFAGVYATASVFDLISAADAPASRWTTLAFSGACLAAALALLWPIRQA